jgi:cell division protein FtsI (penicillin-binding protein 3)
VKPAGAKLAARSRRPLRRSSSTRRLNVTMGAIAIVITLVLGRLVQLQGADAARYRSDGLNLRALEVTTPAVRGEILSSNGTVLAMTVQTDTVYADPPVLSQSVSLAGAAAKLAEPLKMTRQAILALLEHPTSRDYVVLKKSVSSAAAARIGKLGLAPGVSMTATYQRAYPGRELAAPLLGFVDTNARTGLMTGEAGLEQRYDSLLAGTSGRAVYELGGNGQPIPDSETNVKAAVPAGNLRLTINSDIQWEAEHECAVQVAKTGAKNCTVVVMQPSTGKVLALAQYPTFNPAAPASLAATTDLAVSNIWAPGSTAKVITAAAAFQDAGLTPRSSFVVPDVLRWHGSLYHDAETHPTLRYTIAGIIAHSLNDGMVQVAGHVSPRQQYAMFRALGIGSKSALNLPNESPGILAPPSRWTGGQANTRYQISFGQSVSVTAVQMADVYATIANGGVRVPPSVIAGHTTADGRYLPAARPAGRRVMSAHTAAELMGALEQVPVIYSQAGEPWATIPGYTVAAKTGTAQEFRPSGTFYYGSSLIGIAPASSRGLVVAVNLQRPRNGYFGIDVAGPVFNAVMKFALATMKVPPGGGHVPNVPLTVP